MQFACSTFQTKMSKKVKKLKSWIFCWLRVVTIQRERVVVILRHSMQIFVAPNTLQVHLMRTGARDGESVYYCWVTAAASLFQLQIRIRLRPMPSCSCKSTLFAVGMCRFAGQGILSSFVQWSFDAFLPTIRQSSGKYTIQVIDSRRRRLHESFDRSTFSRRSLTLR